MAPRPSEPERPPKPGIAAATAQTGGATMTKRTKRPGDDPVTSPKLDIQRVRVNRDGYDASGAYWGAGPDVFIATTPDGADEITVRARNVADARDKVAAELTRQPGAAKPKDEPIGGASPRKTKLRDRLAQPRHR